MITSQAINTYFVTLSSKKHSHKCPKKYIMISKPSFSFKYPKKFLARIIIIIIIIININILCLIDN